MIEDRLLLVEGKENRQEKENSGDGDCDLV